MTKVYVGTSGWVYPDWTGKFYPADLAQRKWLEYYSQHFKTVEVNATFYRQMKQSTFENWVKTVPFDFIFSVKASRFITHIKRLKPADDSLVRFIESVSFLDKKLGPILFQLPPRLKIDTKKLEIFFSELRAQNLRLKAAFEFRDRSWFDDAIYQILKKHNAALVISESGGHPTSPRELRGARWPSEEVITADFTYIRFHGEGGSYASKYTDDELAEWAAKIKKWQKQGVDVYAYFNNDVAGFAVENAKTLAGLLQ